MDFTQHNKINSMVPKNFQNRSQSSMPSFPQQRQAFSSQTRQQYQNINHPYPSPINQNQFGHPNGNQNYFVHRSGGDMSQNFMQKPISFNQQAFSLDSGMNCASKSFQQSEIQSHEQHRINQDEEEEQQPSDEEQVNIEYFQCSPSPSTVTKHQNPFKPVMQSMRQFSMTKPTKCHQHAETNHQTFMFTHEDEEPCEEITNFTQQKLYRSHTRIVSIPNGVKIVTEILKEDASTDSDESCSSPNHKTKDDDEWVNKQIEVSIDGVESRELIGKNSKH